MLASTTTPMSPKRPQPPGRLSFGKRGLTMDTQHHASPPPPYDNTSSLKQLHDVFGDSDTAPVTTLLGSSVVATAQVLGYELPKTDAANEIQNEEVLQQKSREELFELLKNAEQVIRTHETELNIAALAGEALLRENNLLRSRHDSLLARVKPGQYDSMRSLGHGMRTSGSFEQHLVPSGPPTPAAEIPPPVTPPRRGHARRLSASPEQIAQLNNQNDELHTRLEKIISDANLTDRESKRRLRQLQKEIEGLRNELESTQRRNAELENVVADNRTDGRRVREEREEQLLAARAKGRTNEDDEDDTIKDFAPGSFTSSSSSRLSLNSMPSSGSMPGVPFPSRAFASDLDTIPATVVEDEEDDDNSASVRRRSRLTSCTPEEFTLLAQILSKVKELEDANNTISQSQKEMQDKLEKARQEADQMKNVYDGLQLEEVEGIDSNGEPVRFLSLRAANTAKQSTFRRIASASMGVQDDLHLPDSPVLTTSSENPLFGLSKPRKYRRPIDKIFPVSLDDPFEREDTERTIRPPPRRAPRTPPPSLQSTLHGSIRVTAASPPSQQEASPTATEPRPGMLAPSPSFLGLHLPSLSSFMSSTSSAAVAPRTLEDELGADFGTEWQSSRPDSSIFDESFDVSAMADDDQAGEYDQEEEQGEHPAMAALREALDPANTGKTLEPGEHILPEGCLASAPGEAFSLLGRAVVARPNRWVARSDGRPLLIAGPPRFRPKHQTQPIRPEDDPWETTRYPEEDLPPSPPQASSSKLSLSRRRNSALGRLTNARDRRMSTIQREQLDEFQLVQTEEADDSETPKRTVREKVQAKGIEIVLELWLILQFVVVLGVFVFVMARKGPRAVLGEPAAGKRRSTY